MRIFNSDLILDKNLLRLMKEWNEFGMFGRIEIRLNEEEIMKFMSLYEHPYGKIIPYTDI